MSCLQQRLTKNKPSLKFLLATVAADAKSFTGILLNTGVQVVPGHTLVSSIKNRKLQEVPVGEEWKVPLIHSLLEIRSGEFKLEFDDDVPDVKLWMMYLSMSA